MGSKFIKGLMVERKVHRLVALGVPTDDNVAEAWRLRLDRVTWSKSMTRIRPNHDVSTILNTNKFGIHGTTCSM
jgi:hypothetical protein